MTEPTSEQRRSPSTPGQAGEGTLVSHEAVALADLTCFPMGPFSRNCRTILRQPGELVLAVGAEAFLFLWFVDVEHAVVRTRVSVPLGEWISHRFEISFDHDVLRLISHYDLIEISCRDWKVLSRRCFGDFATEGSIIEESLLPAGSPYLWLRTSLPEDTLLVEIETWTVHRRLDGHYPILTQITGADPLICFTEQDIRSKLYHVDGTACSGDLPVDYLVYSMACAPRGTGLTTLELEEDPDSLYDVHDLIWRYLVPTESGSFRIADTLSRRVVEAGSHKGTYRILVSRDHGMSYMLVHLNRRKRDKHLLAVSISEDALRVRYRVEVPFDLILAQDPQARQVVAIFTDGQGLRVLPLDRSRPSFDHLPDPVFDRGYLNIPKIELDSLRSCGQPGDDEGRSRSLPLSREAERMSPSDRISFLGHYRVGFHDNVEELVDLHHTLEFLKLGTEDEEKKELDREQVEVYRLLAEEHSEHPSAALVLAGRDAVADRWPEVRRWLRLAQTADFQDCRKGHVLHLLGLALLHEGRSDAAFEAFKEAKGYDRADCHCYLSNLDQLTRPMADPPEESEWSPDQPLLRQVLGAIRTANHALEAGDPEAVLAALDRPVFWQIGEVQIAARLAEVFLRESGDSEADLFQTRYVLAYFRQLHCHRLHRREVRLPGVTWDRERLDRLDEEAGNRLGCGFMCELR